jgi:lambda family phage holin
MRATEVPHSMNKINDIGGASSQVISDIIGPGLMGAFVVIMRVIYKGGRKKWRATIAEATLIAFATGTMGLVLTAMGIDHDMAYPIAVFVGYIGVDRVAIAVCKRLGID